MKLPINRNIVPQLVPHFILERFAAGQKNGRLHAVTLSIDISGFTPLTETLLNYNTDGAEVLGSTLQKIFSPLVRQVKAHGGLIPLYAGDAFTAIFTVPTGQEAETTQQIWELACFMQDHFTQDGRSRLFPTPHGNFAIGIKIGLALGPVYWGIPGQENRYTFYFRGPAINQAVAAQKRGEQGAIGVHQSLFPFLAHLPGGASNREIMILTRDDFAANPANRKEPSFQPALDDMPPLTVEQLRPFIPAAVLSLPVEAEFREICPTFITFTPPANADTLHQWVVAVMAVVKRYGGTFGQLEFNDQGGVIVLWFGAPVSYENNTARAVECLLAVQAEQDDNSPPWRAGLTYGLVWAGLRGVDERREYGAIGDVVNTAARIANTAEEGQIWLDEAAANRLRASYQLQLLGLFALKGKKTAVPLYQLMAVKTQLHIMFQGHMVGRELELEQLMLSISPIFKGHFAGAAFVFGDAGMGKSRLIYELRQLLARWVIWAACPAEEILRQSLNPFRHFLRDFFSQTLDQSDEKRIETFHIILREQLEELEASTDPRAAGLHQELDRTRSMLAVLLDIYWPGSLYEQLPPKLRAENTFTAITTLFKALSLKRPLVIHLEDSHWLDTDSERLLTSLSRQLQDYPVAFLFTSRYLDDGSQPQPHLAPNTPKTTIHLQTLNQKEVQAIAEQLLDHQVDTEVIELLAEKSNGQPFFAEQFILDLQECGALQKRDGRIALTDHAPNYFPSSLNAILITRLDRLNPAVKQVVQAASILGERFSVPVLAAILEQDQHLHLNLQIAVEKQIWTMVDELRYLFKHALLRDAAYHMQLHSRRRDLHHLAAETYNQLYTQNLTPYYEQIAYHYDAAYQLGLTEVHHQAIHYQLKAGQQAFENFEHEAALRHLNRALTLTPNDDRPRRFEILTLREKIYCLLSDRAAQLQDLKRLAELAQYGRFPEWQSEVLLLQANYATDTNDYQNAINLAQQAIWLAGENDDPYRQVSGYLIWARALIWQRDFRTAQEPLSLAHSLTTAHKLTDLEAEILRDLGYITGQLGDYASGKAYTEQALVICQKLGNKSGESANLGNLGGMYIDQGRFNKAQYYLEAALTIFRQMGKRLSIAITLHGLGELTCHQGCYKQSQSYFEEALALYREAENRKLEAAGLYRFGLNSFYLGDYEEARRCHETALALAVPSSPDEADAHYGLGKTLVALGDLEQAAAHLDKAVLLRRRAGYTALAIEGTAELAQIAQAQGNQNQALKYVDEILAYLDNGGHLDGTVAPFQIHLTCYEILKSAVLSRANQILEQAYHQLTERAERFEDKDGRWIYLHHIEWHRTIVEEWERLHNRQPEQNQEEFSP